jgi:hypothetical protein
MQLGWLRMLLEEDALTVTSEEVAFDAAVRWCRAQRPDPDTAAQLFSAIRYPQIARPFYRERVLPELLLHCKVDEEHLLRQVAQRSCSVYPRLRGWLVSIGGKGESVLASAEWMSLTQCMAHGRQRRQWPQLVWLRVLQSWAASYM